MRALLVGLLVACLAAGAFLLVVDHFAARAQCVPAEGPSSASAFRAMTTPDDGCGHVRARAMLHVPAALLAADAVALGVSLAWRSRWRVAGAALPLAGLLYLLPVALFALLWEASCGPVETYVGGCSHPRWLYVPWVALSLVVVATVLIEGRRPRAPPSRPR